ncbi:MAG: class I SAM-dependent methyltransferase [Planctomycetes bacterium]|nr:class I SAM-dependent methyltransferase [Planctomycetota bacterium]
MEVPSTLYSLLARPEPFQRGKTSFWEEPHISAQLLAAHLDPTFEGASRNPGYIDASVEWLAAITPAGRYPDVLDVGCGPGLYAKRLCDKLYRVTGIDFSRRSIDYARDHAAATNRAIIYHYGNYLEMAYQDMFDLAIMIYCDFGALSPEEGQTLLRRIHGSLRPGGKLILDVFSLRKYEAFLERREWRFHADGGFWRPDAHFTIEGDSKYGESVTLEQTTVVTPESARTYHIWNRYFTTASLEEELRAAGFRVCGFYADVTGKPVTDASETVAVVAERMSEKSKCENIEL